MFLFWLLAVIVQSAHFQFADKTGLSTADSIELSVTNSHVNVDVSVSDQSTCRLQSRFEPALSSGWLPLVSNLGLAR